MTIEAIGAVPALAAAPELAPLAPTAPSSAAAPTGFAEWFTQQVGAVNRSVVASENDMRKLAAGEVQSLHEVMIRMEEAKLSFQLLAQVRNRVLEAYQEVMRTQV